MKRIRLIGLLVVSFCVGCTQKLICPAYQSAFIFDKPTQRETFFYYNESKDQSREVVASNSKTITLPPRDSTWSKSDGLPGPALPKERRVRKDRYLLLPDKTYKKALRSLQTVPMKPVYPKKVEDSVAIAPDIVGAELDSADSVSLATGTGGKPKQDSVYVISTAKEKFNVDQDIYMWYFRDVLVLPDVRIAMEGAQKDAKPGAKGGKKEKGGFFKNLFKKKEKSDSTARPAQISTNDSTATPSKEKKKGLGGLLKKKSKTSTPPPTKKADPAKKEEEDDGF